MKNRILRLVKSQTARNASFMVSEALLWPIMAIILLPIFFDILDIQTYGIYILVSSFSALVSVLNLGGAVTVTKFISAYRGSEQTDKIKEFSSTIFVFQLAIFTVFILSSSLAIVWVPSLFSLKSNNIELMQNILLYSIPTVFVEMMENNYNGLHKGYERFDRALYTSIVVKLLRFLAQLIGIVVFRDLVKMYQIMLTIWIFTFAGHSVLCKKWYPEIGFFLHAKWSMLKEFFQFSVGTWSISVVWMINSQVDKLIVTALFDLKTLGYYGISLRIFDQLHGLVVASTYWLFPKISFSGVTERIRSLYNKVISVVAVISITGTLFLLLTGDIIFSLWLGKEQYSNIRPLVNIFISILPIRAIGILPYYAILAMGNTKYLLKLLILEAVFGLSGLYLFSKYFELQWGIAAFGISYAISGFFYIRRCRRLLVIEGSTDKMLLAGVVIISLLYLIFMA